MGAAPITADSLPDLLPILTLAWGEDRLVSAPDPRADSQPWLGSRVRAWRIGRRWSIVEAACRAGVSPSMWQRIEAGDHVPWAWQVSRIADALGTSHTNLTLGSYFPFEQDRLLALGGRRS